MARRKPRKKKPKGKKQQSNASTYILTALLIAAIVVGVFYAARTAGWLGAAPETVVPTDYQLVIHDYATGEDITDDVDLEWFEYEVQTGDYIEDLMYSDFTALSGSSRTLTPEADMVYVAHISLTGYTDVWVTTSPLIADGDLTQLFLGVNTILMMNESDGMNLVAYNTESTAPITVADTTARNWNLDVYQLDSDDTLTNLQGYRSYYDFENDQPEYFVIRVEFNTTAEAGWVNTVGVDSVRTASTDYVFLEIPATLLGIDSFKIRFGAGLGESNVCGDYAAVGIAIGTGYAGDFTSLATQA